MKVFYARVLLVFAAIVLLSSCNEKISKSNKNEITKFSVEGFEGYIGTDEAGLKYVIVEITDDNFDLTSVEPTIEVSEGAKISPKSGVIQDFSDSENSPIVYTVTAEDGTKASYNTAIFLGGKGMTSFKIRVAHTVYSADITEPFVVDEVYTNGKITLELPAGTDLTILLSPIIELPEGSTVAPESGVAQDFSDSVANPIEYTVTTENDYIFVYDASITLASTNTEAKILNFAIVGSTSVDIVHPTTTGNGTISVIVPFGTDVAKLTPSITLSTGATVSPASGTEQDFSNSATTPIPYTVTAEDGMATGIYDVTITVTAANPNATILHFEISVNDISYTGAIDETAKTITLSVPNGSDVANLTPTITISQFASIAPESGITQDFTNPVTYTVTAQDTATATVDYTVTVNVAPADASSAKQITSFIIATKEASINETTTPKTITLELPAGTNLSSLAPIIELSENATVNPASATAQNFTNPVSYTVTAEDASQTIYEVTITTATDVVGETTLTSGIFTNTALADCDSATPPNANGNKTVLCLIVEMHIFQI